MSIVCALMLLPCAQDAAPKKPPRELPPFDKARVEALVEQLGREAIAAHVTPGLVIAVAKDHEIVVARAFGVGGIEGREALTPASRFCIGTLERQFMAVGVLRLVDAKTLALDDALSTLWPTFPTGGRAVTLSHLLANTAGLPSVAAILARHPEARGARLLPETFTKLFADATWSHEPGEGFELDTAGWSVLAAILSTRSGETAEEYVTKHMIEPLGLAHTAYVKASQAPAVLDESGKVPLLLQRIAAVRHGEPTTPEKAAPESSPEAPHDVFVSNAQDLVRWQKALVDRAVFSERASRLIMSPAQLADGNSTHYGFAIEMSRLGEFKCYAATGTTADMPIASVAGRSAPSSTPASAESAARRDRLDHATLARLAYYSLPHVTVVVLANGASAPVERIERALGRSILGVPEPTAVDLPLATDDAHKLVGNYLIGAARHAIEWDGAHLVCTSSDEGSHTLLNQGHSVFAWSDEPDVLVAFELEKGSATKFTRTRRGFASVARRVETSVR